MNCATGWSRSGTFAQIRSQLRPGGTRGCWSRSGTFAQIRSPTSPSAGAVAGVGREPSLRYADEQRGAVEPFAGVGREPSLRYAREPRPQLLALLESVGNLRSDTLRPPAARARPSWSRSGTFAQIRFHRVGVGTGCAGVGREPSLRYADPTVITRTHPAGVGREPSLRYALGVHRPPRRAAGVGREPSLRYAGQGDQRCSPRLESVGNLRSDTLPTIRGRL